MPSAFCKSLATRAWQQHDKYHLLRETQPPLAAQIATYWTDLGLSFPGTGTAWSAVFVSWCVLKAGATAQQFAFSPRHGVYVKRAIDDAKAGRGVFHGHPVDACAPKVGDILHNNRNGHAFDFAHAATHTRYESHAAIVVEVGVDSRGHYLRTIGGNESDSVGLKEVRLGSTGRVLNASGLYISVIETLL